MSVTSPCVLGRVDTDGDEACTSYPLIPCLVVCVVIKILIKFGLHLTMQLSNGRRITFEGKSNDDKV